jgi:hypothetical protein
MSIPEADTTTGLTNCVAVSITDKRRFHPTAKDNALAGDLFALRYALIREPTVQRRLRELLYFRLIELPGPVPEWNAAAALRYYAEIGRLSTELDGAFGDAELVDLTGDYTKLESTLKGDRGLSLGTYIGHDGRGRRMADETIELVARSLALRAGGLGVTQADELVGQQAAPSLPRPAQDIAVYRKRVRDRHPSARLPLTDSIADANSSATAGNGNRLDGHHPSLGARARGCRCGDCVGLGVKGQADEAPSSVRQLEQADFDELAARLGIAPLTLNLDVEISVSRA